MLSRWWNILSSVSGQSVPKAPPVAQLRQKLRIRRIDKRSVTGEYVSSLLSFQPIETSNSCMLLR